MKGKERERKRRDTNGRGKKDKTGKGLEGREKGSEDEARERGKERN